MPNFLNNWTFEDIEEFLTKNHYFKLVNTDGSHHYFHGKVDGADKLVEIQYHAGESIHPKTLRHYVILKSGIPERYWLEFAAAGKKSLRKRVYYLGAAQF
jgi:predicted RNA binding protein YcfA (HicA-like mRNA interferase family)